VIDPALFDLPLLIEDLFLLRGHAEHCNAWRRDCEIIPDYMPPYPKPATGPRCVVRFIPSGMFLRHSTGPQQGHFWDVYGDDYLRPSLALIAIAQAPPPHRLEDGTWFKGFYTFTMPLPAREEGKP
jgi:hypothetical protein